MVISAWNWVHVNHPGPRPLEGGEVYPWNEWHGMVWAWWLYGGVELSLDLGWHCSRLDPFCQFMLDAYTTEVYVGVHLHDCAI